MKERSCYRGSNLTVKKYIFHSPTFPGSCAFGPLCIRPARLLHCSLSPHYNTIHLHSTVSYTHCITPLQSRFLLPTYFFTVYIHYTTYRVYVKLRVGFKRSIFCYFYMFLKSNAVSAYRIASNMLANVSLGKSSESCGPA